MVYLVSELGQQISNTYEDIEDIIGQFGWYLLPQKIMQIFPIILINSQEPATVQCIGSISCDRDVAKKVNLAKKIKNIAVTHIHWV